MNANFLGKPSREDLHTLEQLRRQLVPMIRYVDNLQAEVAHKTHHGETVEWPQIRSAVSTINAYLASINNYMNGHYKHTSEELRDSEGKIMLDEEKNPRVKYRDDEVTGEKDRLDALHVFPMAPFPMANEKLAGMGLTLLNKRLDPAEEKWVEERLQKAAEFAYVPGDLGVDLKKPEMKKDANEEDDDEDMDGWDAGLPTKRIKGTLNEDDLMEMWAVGHKTAFDRRYQREKGFGDGGEGAGEGEDDEDEDEEMEDVEVDGLKPSQGQDGTPGDAAMEEDEEDEEDESDDARGRPAPPVQLIQQAQPSVHKPVAGAPIMALSMVHRFMSSGEVQPPAGQR